MAKDNYFSGALGLSTKPVVDLPTATETKQAFTNLSDLFTDYSKKVQAEHLANLETERAAQLQAGTLDPSKFTEGISLISDPEKRKSFLEGLNTDLKTQRTGRFDAALNLGQRTGQFGEAEQYLNSITNPIEREELLTKYNTALDAYRKADIGLRASTGTVADIDAQIAQVQSDTTIPLAQKAGLIKELQTQRGITAPREVQQSAMADMATLRSDIDWNQYVGAGLAQSLALPDVIGTPSGYGKGVYLTDGAPLQNDPMFDQNFEVINGAIIPRDIESGIRQKLALQGITGAALNERLAEEMKPHIEYQQKIQQKLQEYLPDTGAKPLDLATRRDANRLALLERAIQANLTPEQIALQQAQANLLDTAKFDLGKGAAASLEQDIKATNDKAQVAIKELKETSAVFSKLSDLEFQELKSATSGIRSITDAVNNVAQAGAFTTDYGDKAEVVKKVRGLLGKEITFGEGTNTTTKKPTEAQIALAIQMSPLDTWWKPSEDGKGYVDLAVLETSLKDLMQRGVGDTQALKIKYGAEAVNAIEQVNKAEQQILNRAAEDNLRATNRAYAQAKLPSPIKGSGNPLDMFRDILRKASNAIISPAAAADSSSTPGSRGDSALGTNNKQQRGASGSWAESTDKYKNTPNLSVYDKAIEKAKKEGNTNQLITALKTKLFTLSNTEGVNSPNTLEVQAQLKAAMGDTVVYNNKEYSIDQIMDAIAFAETGTVPETELATVRGGGKSTGGIGKYQVIRSTAVDPGFGIKNIFQLADERGIKYSGKGLEDARVLLEIPELNKEFAYGYMQGLIKEFGPEKALRFYRDIEEAKKDPKYFDRFNNALKGK